MPADRDLMMSIRRVEQDIRESRDHIKDLTADRKEQVLQMSAHLRVEEIKKDLRDAQEYLKGEIKVDNNVSALDAKIAEERSKLTDLHEILSIHLVKYRDDTDEKEVKFDEDDGKVRPILVTAKLGKPEFHQEEMFAEGK